MNPSITITVMDTATIFEGPETVFRYDLSGRGLADGSDLDGVLEQVENLLGPEWRAGQIAVLADPSAGAASHSAVVVLTRHLRLDGVTVVGAEQLAAAGTVVNPPTEEFAPPLTAPGTEAAAIPPDGPPRGAMTVDDAGGHNASDMKDVAEAEAAGAVNEPVPTVRRIDREPQRLLGWFEPFHAVIAAVVVVIVGVSMWWVGRPSAEPQPVNAAAPSATVGPAESSASESSVAELPAAASSAANAWSSLQARPTMDRGVALHAGGMSVTLPRGFTASEEDGLVTAKGLDPNLRVLFAADPLYSVPAAALFAEMRSEIDSDPTLSNPAEKDGKLSYLEQPGDESRVAWTTWVQDGHQLSVGCHTRFEPTTVHKAACRMAVESLKKT